MTLFDTPAQRHAELCNAIEKADKAYYEDNDPIIPDSKYDLMMKEVRQIEAEHPELATPTSPTQTVRGKASSKFGKFEHVIPMLSLDNCFNYDDLVKFDKTLKELLGLPLTMDLEYMCELKGDGLGLKLQYVKGIFSKAGTRGTNGTVGEDVTANVMAIDSIPKKLNTDTPPDLFEVSGECYMTKAALAGLNKERLESGDKVYANERNAASGALRTLDVEETRKRNLSFMAFAPGQVIGAKGNFVSQEQFFATMEKVGIPFNPHRELVYGINGVQRFYERISEIRDSLDMPIDGVVVKLNDYNLQAEAGKRSKSPRWATAYKFPAQRVETIVTNVEHCVGRTGVITPRADLKPVAIGGVTVSSSTLHNYDRCCTELDIHEGDTVIMERAGDVIPAIIGVIKEKRPEGAVPIARPAVCPACGAPVMQVTGEVALRCSSEATCPAQLQESLSHFVHKKAMNLDGVGPQIIEALLTSGRIRTAADIYNLTLADIVMLDRMGVKTATKVMNAINDSKTRPLGSFIFALGIREVGEVTARKLAEEFGSVEKLMTASTEELLAIPDVGPSTASSIQLFFSNPSNKAMIQKMFELGVAPVAKEKVEGGILAGQTFVFTGALTRFTRDEAHEMVLAHGGKFSGNVSKKTSYLVAGANAGGKMEKAADCSVPVITEDDFLKMIGSEGGVA